jgi:hypothetical protein
MSGSGDGAHHRTAMAWRPYQRRRPSVATPPDAVRMDTDPERSSDEALLVEQPPAVNPADARRHEGLTPPNRVPRRTLTGTRPERDSANDHR